MPAPSCFSGVEPGTGDRILLTSMNSELEPTCWRKHSRKFSSVGRIWASCGEHEHQGGTRASRGGGGPRTSREEAP